jgi:hypothetical protein
MRGFLTGVQVFGLVFGVFLLIDLIAYLGDPLQYNRGLALAISLTCLTLSFTAYKLKTRF